MSYEIHCKIKEIQSFVEEHSDLFKMETPVEWGLAVGGVTFQIPDDDQWVCHIPENKNLIYYISFNIFGEYSRETISTITKLNIVLELLQKTEKLKAFL